MTAFVGARIVTPDGVLQNGVLISEDARIAEVGTPNAVRVGGSTDTIDARGLTLLPGFLDVHVHGGGGADVMDATPAALQTVCRIHARHGTTGLLATTITQSRDKIKRALQTARAAWEAGPAFCSNGAQVLGVHLEGPYLCAARAGAQPVEHVRDPDPDEFGSWLEAARGAIRLATLAPERPGSETLIAAARTANVVVSVGHTSANAAQTEQALDRGARHATHLFNAMPSLHHRQPGPLAVLLVDERVRVEVIADGHHVAPEVLRLIFRTKGAWGVLLITDAMAGAGAGDGVYDLGDNPVTVAGGRATLADGTLAGSVLTMDRAGANVRDWLGLDWPDVARLSSTNAADQMGWPQKGRLSPGADADLVLVDDTMTVHATFVAGRCVYRR